MKLKVEIDGQEKEITLNNPKGRHTKKGLKLFTSIKGEEGEEDVNALNIYLDYLDEIAAECTGMTIDKLDDLDSDEKNKIIEFYQEKVQGRLDFLRSSVKQAGYSPRDTQE